jgi:hypothetical protein
MIKTYNYFRKDFTQQQNPSDQGHIIDPEKEKMSLHTDLNKCGLHGFSPW